MNASNDTCNHCTPCGDILSTHNCVSLVPIFNHLEPSQMDEIMSVILSKSFKKGEIIYRAGDSSSALYIVSRGRIKIYRLSESGKEQLIRILNPGEFTGEYALFNESIHESYAEAMEDTNVCMIERSDLQSFLLRFPSISLKLLQEFSQRLESAEEQTTRFATEKVDTRIALFLIECVDKSDNNTFNLPMSKKDLSSFLGTTPETISRKLKEFEESGLIHQLSHKRIQVIDYNGLLDV